MKSLINGIPLLKKIIKIKQISRQISFQTNYRANTNKYFFHRKYPIRIDQSLFTGKHYHTRRTPDLIYVPHVLRWLKTKFRFKYLQKTWDPEFSEGAFIYGTTQAVCKITGVINDNKPDKLEGLLTQAAKIKLQEDMASKITAIQKQIIRLKPEDIKILVPISVNLTSNGVVKKCNVALRSLALKWYEDTGSVKLVLVALQTEFVRDYSDGASSEWTISVFEVLECAMLSEAPTAQKRS